MAKIDISKIDGYADMTPEQKIAALEAFETEDPDYSGYVKKDIFDKTASELAAKKKELNEKLTEDAYIVPGLGDAGDRIFGTK